MKEIIYSITDCLLFQQQLLYFFQNKRNIVFLNSNESGKKNVLALADTDNCDEQSAQYGFITYDYKNQIEDLSSAHFDGIGFPEKHFFTPELLFDIGEAEVEVRYSTLLYTENDITEMLAKVEKTTIVEEEHDELQISAKVSKEEYITHVNSLKNHIQQGDIYEINYCQEFYAEAVQLHPIATYLKLNKKSPTPFSCFVKHDNQYLLSASPERFIQKTGDKITSQPIKGTIKRGRNEQEDELLKQQLFNDPKEKSENVMIVDLVRNDISKIAQKDTVKVDELCGIYTYPQVHQMISTVSATLTENVSLEEILKATFPMGSMTGAPKISAMKLIEKYEVTKRGLYSGAVGYISSSGDFDFNVVIRSIQYNAVTNYLSFMVGGAITHLSDAEKEYEECMLKAKAIFEVLNA